MLSSLVVKMGGLGCKLNYKQVMYIQSNSISGKTTRVKLPLTGYSRRKLCL
jgi:hypothetical protein